MPLHDPSPLVTAALWGVAITEVGAGGGAESSCNASLMPPFWVWRGQEGLQEGWLFLQPLPRPGLQDLCDECAFTHHLCVSTVCWELC